MFAILMALVLAVLTGGLAWLVLGNRLRLDPDPHQNEVLNVGAYVAMAFPVIFLLIWIWAP